MDKLLNKQSSFQHYINYWIRVDIAAFKMQVIFGIRLDAIICKYLTSDLIIIQNT